MRCIIGSAAGSDRILSSRERLEHLIDDLTGAPRRSGLWDSLSNLIRQADEDLYRRRRERQPPAELEIVTMDLS